MKYTNYMVLATFVAVIMGFVVITSSVHAAPFTLLDGTNLTTGSTGQNVMELQGILSELGYLNVPITIPYGYFGTLTKGALAQYQVANGISPAQGYFGPITRQHMQDDFSSKGWLTLLNNYSY